MKFELKTLLSTNQLYRTILHYSYYLLNIRGRRRNGRYFAKVKDLIKSLRIGTRELRLDGRDPGVIVEFLIPSVTEDGLLEMSEGQSFMALPRLTSSFRLWKYRAISGSLARNGGRSMWYTEAAQYSLRIYGTSPTILEAIRKLRDFPTSGAGMKQTTARV